MEEIKADKRTEKRKTGDAGEDLAADYLISKKYSVIERNFNCKTGEIDIIAIKDNVIAFVEVKSRNTLKYGLPCEAVNYKKRRRILCTAYYFLLINSHYRYYQPRMDIIEILQLGEKKYIRHTENAFSEE